MDRTDDAGRLDPILTLPAVTLAAKIRAGELSPVEVVEAHIRRIEAVNPTLNAMVADRFDAALAEARRAESTMAGPGPVPPLLGVPFTVKEMIDVEGMPVTFGALARAGRVAERDATIVRRLRAAGAIPLGVTNVPEWGFWFETDNLVYGRTRNPYDPERGAGGSSGGEAALIGAGGAPFGLGSDIGGSIRIPSAFCGVFGHKPTHGLLPLTGHYPVYASGPEASLRKINPFLTLGPLARSARDLLPLLRITAGEDDIDPNARPIALGEAEAGDWRGRRVLVLEVPRISLAARPDAAVREAVRRAALAFQARGAIVEPLPDDTLRRAVMLWLGALRSLGGPSFDAIAGTGGKIRLGPELLRILAGRPRYSLPVLVFCLGERIGRLSTRQVRSLVAEGRTLARRIRSALGTDGILLMPAHPRTAPRHNYPLIRPFDFAYTAIFNTLLMPATAVPVGFDRTGLPLGVQVVAAPGDDRVTIAAAVTLEDELGGWRPPCLDLLGAPPAHGGRGRYGETRRSGTERAGNQL